MCHKRVGRLSKLALIAFAAVAVLAGIKGFFQAEGENATFGEKPYIEAGVPYSLSTSIGGTLEPFPSVLFPSYPEGSDPATPGDASPDGESVAPGSNAVGNRLPELLNLPTDFPGLTLPTHVDHDAVTVEAASVRVSQQGGVLSIPEAEAVLRAAGALEEWIPDFIAIGQCESHLSPGSRGDNHNSLGWLQMWRGWAAAIGVEPDELHDPLINARAGVYVRTVRGRFGGQGGWTCADLLGIP